MKFIATVNLWAEGIQDRILAGTLRIQRGQWTQCGAGPRSRFVGVRNGIFWVAHSEGDRATRDSFPRMVKAFG
jgi:hypothetical protein